MGSRTPVNIASIIRTRKSIQSTEEKQEKDMRILSNAESIDIKKKAEEMMKKRADPKAVIKLIAGDLKHSSRKMIDKLSEAGHPLAKEIDEYERRVIRREGAINEVKRELSAKTEGNVPRSQLVESRQDLITLRTGTLKEIEALLKKYQKEY